MRYVWKCDGCHTIEQLDRPISESRRPPFDSYKCPTCGGNWEKQLTAPAHIGDKVKGKAGRV
jgi:transposase-like protein